MRIIPHLLLLPLLATPGCGKPTPVNPPYAPTPPPVIQEVPIQPWTEAIQEHPAMPPSTLPARTTATITLQQAEGVFPVFGNKRWVLTLNEEGKQPIQLEAVTGRANTQDRDRHKSGTKAPLPVGQYTISTTHKGPFSIPEIGGLYFVDLIPQFNTGRSDLGIHHDPSFERDKKEDGTDGCIALTNAQDLQTVVNFILRTRAISLTVLN